ncbi:MAG: aldo/keto reductase [Bacteroidetes bacterium]|nr:aldo/keto reductase [Bacteroidota bacterium]
MTKTKNHIGLGTAAIGRPQYINIKKEDSEIFNKTKFKQQGIHVLETAYNKGIRYFDTAPGYGMAQEILLEWLNTKKDKSIEVATKWGYSYVANFDPNAIINEVKDHSLQKLLSQWEKSKELMPNLTTYQIHSATFETGVLDNEEVLYKLAELKDHFQLKIGITTSGSNQVEILKKSLDITVNGTQLFDAFQVTYNMLDQSLLNIAEEMNANGKRIIIKEALANGRIFRNKNYANYNPLYNTLEALATKYKVGVDAIALRFCIDTVNPFMVLSGASAAFQISENLKANQFEIEKQDIDLLKSFKVAPNDYWNERKKLSWN